MLRNFSDEGFGVWINPPLPKDLSNQSSLSGQVSLENKMYPVELKLAHASGRHHGLKIISESQELKEKLRTLLEPSVYAESLTQKKLSDDPETGLPRLYYTGKGGAEVCIWYHPGHLYIVALQACFLGKWIFRKQRDEKKMGLLTDHFKSSEGLKILNTDLISIDPKELSGIPEKASQFLASVPQPLPGHLLWQFYESGETIFLPKEVFQPLKVA